MLTISKAEKFSSHFSIIQGNWRGLSVEIKILFINDFLKFKILI